MQNWETILYEKKGKLGIISLNRPRSLNVYNLKMRDELFQTLGAIKEDKEIGCLILRGEGEKAFCAGADLSEFLTAPSPVIAREARWGRDVWGLFLSLEIPVIAALHGYILGSGIEMALCCDIRIASEDAIFGLPEARLGIIPAAGATQTLPRVINKARAMEMLLTGAMLNVREAYQLKLVNRVVPRQTLVQTAIEMAEKICSRAPLAVRSMKQAVLRGLDMGLEAGMELESQLGWPLRFTKDAEEGVRAFMEKRQPMFQGK